MDEKGNSNITKAHTRKNTTFYMFVYYPHKVATKKIEVVVGVWVIFPFRGRSSKLAGRGVLTVLILERLGFVWVPHVLWHTHTRVIRSHPVSTHQT